MSLTALDRRLLIAARTRGHGPRLDRSVAAFSKLGDQAGCWLALGMAGGVLDRDADRRVSWRRSAAWVAASYGVNQTIKIAVRRHRPVLEDLPPLAHTITQLSFPSAHATTSFTAARLYSSLLGSPGPYGAALALTYSRVYLGVHYPSDVITGAALGTLLATAAGGSRWR